MRFWPRPSTLRRVAVDVLRFVLAAIATNALMSWCEAHVAAMNKHGLLFWPLFFLIYLVLLFVIPSPSAPPPPSDAA